MTKVAVLVLLCMCNLFVVAEEIPKKELKKLKRSVKILSVSDRKTENQEDEKIFLLKFDTNQDEDNDEQFKYRFRVTVEITDKAKNTYFAQVQASQRALHEDYLGEDTWEFHIPIGNMERPKLSACVIQYGILHEGKFIPLNEDFDDVDTVEELTERSPNRLDGNMKLFKHTYLYDEDGTEEENVKIY